LLEFLSGLMAFFWMIVAYREFLRMLKTYIKIERDLMWNILQNITQKDSCFPNHLRITSIV